MAVADTTDLATRAQEALARRGRTVDLKPIEQIRPYNPNSVPEKSAGAYYLRPDGATIADALVWYPNGAIHDREYDPKGKYSENASYYHDRQRRKGFEYIGPVLTLEGVQKLVAVLQKNQPAEVLRLEDEIAIAEYSAMSADIPEVRDQQRRRATQLRNRLARVQQELDPEALVAELQEIANAQEMAAMPPQIMRVLNRRLGAMRDDLIARFTRTAKSTAGEDATATFSGADSIG